MSKGSRKFFRDLDAYEADNRRQWLLDIELRGGQTFERRKKSNRPKRKIVVEGKP